MLGVLAESSPFDISLQQRFAWEKEIEVLQSELVGIEGQILFEFNVPRMGHRIDVVLISGPAIFAIEFKVGDDRFSASAIDQVWDYGLDLKNFHEESHRELVVPILIATEVSESHRQSLVIKTSDDGLCLPICCRPSEIRKVIHNVYDLCSASIDAKQWEGGRYQPTPTIVEAAKTLYAGHNVEDISRSDASAQNLTITTRSVEKIIRECREKSEKAICFITGVPGAGKTLVGLNVATKHMDPESDLYSVFLSGNGPLVKVLCEALARDKVRLEKEAGTKLGLGAARNKVKAFIQNVHHFRDDCIRNTDRAPIEHVALFDEAQRAWNREKTSDFMRRKKGISDFSLSEPEFLISCLDRHQDWAVIICLVGGGQEINSGEAGIGEWIQAKNRSFPNWKLNISSRLTDSEYKTSGVCPIKDRGKDSKLKDELHLGVSLRSFRAEKLSAFVKAVLDVDIEEAKACLKEIKENYPIAVSRDLESAKNWLRSTARGTERTGLVVSSQASRLKPLAVDVRAEIDPVHYFLSDKSDVRSSYYLEDAATEFHIQGLELDWTCLAWDGDLRFNNGHWENWSFKGSKWQRILKEDRKAYQLNAYRVLMTRARQGMVIVVPKGNTEDPTRAPKFYDATYNYWKSIGVPDLGL